MADPARTTTAATSTPSPTALDGSTPIDSAEPEECRQLTYDEICELLQRIASGQTITENERENLTASIDSLSNAQFALLVRTLDGAGNLQTVLRDLHETPADPAGAANQVEFPVVCYRFWNAADQMTADVRTANTIYGHHGIRINAVSKRTISKGDTERVLGAKVDDNFKLDRTFSGAAGAKSYTHGDMVKVVNEFVPKTAVAGLWAKRVINESGTDLSGTSSPTYSFGASYGKMAAVATDHSGADTFAHELGHILANESHTSGGLMQSGDSRDKTQTGADRLTAAEVTAIKASVLGWVRRAGTCPAR